MSDVSEGLAAKILAARQSGKPATIEAAERPQTAADGYAVQKIVTATLGPIGGWKVGASGPEGAPSGAPLPQSVILPSGAAMDVRYSDRLVESEIAFKLGADLPPRAEPYSREDVIAAITSCHPVIEVVQWRITGFATASAPEKLADNGGHGALIVGDAIPGWQDIDFPSLTVTQTMGADPAKLGRGNPGGEMIRLIQWLANEGAVWAGGLKAGQIVTCGSWTGCLSVAPGTVVDVTFAGIAPVSVSFA